MLTLEQLTAIVEIRVDDLSTLQKESERRARTTRGSPQLEHLINAAFHAGSEAAYSVVLGELRKMGGGK